MTPAQLAAWLLSLPAVADGHGHAIPRPKVAADVFAVVALETDNPTMWAAALDTFAAMESGYRPHVAGDCPGMRAGSLLCTKALGAKSYGLFQAPAATTSEDPATQARAWIAIARKSFAMCPAHPFAPLATGRCTNWGASREAIIRAAVAVPINADGGA